MFRETICDVAGVVDGVAWKRTSPGPDEADQRSTIRFSQQ